MCFLYMYKYGTLKPVSHFTKGEEADNGVDKKTVVHCMHIQKNKILCTANMY
jgi:hypothetical protein